MSGKKFPVMNITSTFSEQCLDLEKNGNLSIKLSLMKRFTGVFTDNDGDHQHRWLSSWCVVRRTWPCCGSTSSREIILINPFSSTSPAISSWPREGTSKCILLESARRFPSARENKDCWRGTTFMVFCLYVTKRKLNSRVWWPDLSPGGNGRTWSWCGRRDAITPVVWDLIQGFLESA